MNYTTKVYPNGGENPTINNSNQQKKNIGLCFSGGGSRALTCAWGQMLGLSTLNLMNNTRYLSSVSGGTWATSIYSFLPDSISDKDLLGTYYTPETLSLTDKADYLNVNTLNEYALGKAPEGMQLDKLVVDAVCFLLNNKAENHKWLWAYIVGSKILDPFNLRAEGNNIWDSSKFFTLSEAYAAKNFNGSSPKDFFFVRQGRPFHIMNNNIMIKAGNSSLLKSNIIQVPNQVTPVAGGARGKIAAGNFNGGGLVESYGVGSTLDQSTATTPKVDIEITQPYSLIDIVSTSSAFFAESIASYVTTYVSDPAKKAELVNKVQQQLTPEHQSSLLSDMEAVESDVTDIFDAIDKKLDELTLDKIALSVNIAPSYNYWPIEKNSQNKEMEYTDGGTLENTGVLGMLSQTEEENNTHSEPIKLVVFDNTDTPLVKKNGNIIAASQIAPLFGIDFDENTGKYQPFTADQKDAQNKNFEATSLIQIFDNTKDSNNKTPFDYLVEGLYASSCGAAPGTQPDDSKACSSAAFHQVKLTTVQNDLAHISGDRSVEILYVQNAKILNWQDRIGDSELKAEILKGQQKPTGIEKLNPFIAFKDFPYYSTFTKIGLEPKESHALSQMWAWALADDESPLKSTISQFMTP